MLGSYLSIIGSPPLVFVTLPWTLLALLASSRGAKWFGIFFAASLIVGLGGSWLLAQYAMRPEVDGDGTTLFSVAILAAVCAFYGFIVFMVCGIVAAIKAYQEERRANGPENIL